LQADAVRFTDLKTEIEDGIAVLREKFDAQLAAERDSFNNEHAAREAASLDRERKSAELLKQREADAAAVSKLKAKLEEKARILAA
jgi:hypothetical protein